MRARSAEFVTSAADAKGFPAGDCPEIAFAGRSNVGKSSLLNTLSGHRSLARTSRTPGRTQLVNWFRVVSPKDQRLHFVDLPGYGFARVPSRVQRAWGPLIESYLQDRPSLSLLLLLIDIRRHAQDEEAQLVEWLQANDIPHTVILTKADKLSKSQRGVVAGKVQRDMELSKKPIVFSSQDGLGVEDVWRLIMRHAKA